MLEAAVILSLAATLWLFLDQVSQEGSGTRGAFDRRALEATVAVAGALLLWLALAPRRIRRRRREEQRARKEARADTRPAPGSG